MLATAGQLPTEARGWVAEAKLDGARAAARVYGGGAQLFSRPGNHLSARFPEVTAALATALDGHRAILDGEIVTLDRRSGVPRFELLQRRLAVAHPRLTLQARIPASLWVFDILHLMRPASDRRGGGWVGRLACGDAGVTPAVRRRP